MSATGRYRNDLIAAAKPAREAPGPASPPAAPAATAPYASWMDRMQRGGRGRHSAITSNINTWSSYKNWAARVRDAWQDEPAPRDPAARKPR
jgi:hypothetical protein